MKKFLLGVVVGAGAMLTTSVFAVGGAEQVAVSIRQAVPIVMKGAGILNFDQKPINYNGTTYVPLREAMQFVSARVDWKGDSIELKPVTQNTARTPDGKYILEGEQEPVSWNGIEFTAGRQMNAPGQVSYPNHSNVETQEEVKIPGGKATLLTLSHDNFTAATPPETGKAATETIYWLYVNQPIAGDTSRVNTYYLSAKAADGGSMNKDIVLRVAQTWNPLTTVPAQMLYVNAENHFSLQLPKSWEGKFEVSDQKTAWGRNYDFNSKAAKGTLFTISVWTKEDWNANKEDVTNNIPITQVGEKDGYVYLFHTPTDVQYDPGDEAVKTEYLTLAQDVEDIRSTFTLQQ